VAQYIILMIAYMIPPVWLSMKQTGVPVPQAVYGYQLQKVTARENVLNDASTPEGKREAEVRQIPKQRVDTATASLKDPEAAFAQGRAAVDKQLADLKAANAPPDQVAKAQQAADSYPKDVDAAKEFWTKEKGFAARAGPIKPHAEPFPGKDEAARNDARLNF